MSANDEQIGGTHYASVIQHWDYAWVNNFDQFQYCITKYVGRHKMKDGLKDLYKAQHHLAKYIELLEAEQDVELEEEKQMMKEMSQGYVRQG